MTQMGADKSLTMRVKIANRAKVSPSAFIMKRTCVESAKVIKPSLT